VWNGIEQGSCTATRGWDDEQVAAGVTALEV
jgi:hypothetical protein